MTRTPVVVPKYWPRSGLRGASSRLASGEPYRNGPLYEHILAVRRDAASLGGVAEVEGRRSRLAAEHDGRLVSGDHGDGLRSLPRRNSTGTVSLGSRAAASSIKPKAGQRLPVVTGGRLSGQHRLVVHPDDDVARADPGICRGAVRGDGVDVGADGIGFARPEVDLETEPGAPAHEELHHPLGAPAPNLDPGVTGRTGSWAMQGDRERSHARRARGPLR